MNAILKKFSIEAGIDW